MKEDWERQPEMFLQELSHSLSKNPNEGLPAENQFDENGEKALSFQDDEIQSVQKIKQYSAEDQENSIVLDQKAILSLKQSRNKQDIFLDSLGHLRDEIIQHQAISHISYGSSKFQRINFREVKEYTRSRIEKMTKNKKYKKNWSSSDIKILVWIVAKFCEKNKIKDSYGGIKEEDWETISSLIPGTTPESCMFKWLGLKKSKVREEKWQKEEQNLLIKLVQKFKEKKWGLVSKKLFQNNKMQDKVYRCGKQCRQHWNSFLNPQKRKGNWKEYEDYLLVQLIHNENGDKKWSKIIHKFQDRTENALKNRFTNLIQKQKVLSGISKKKVSQTFLRQRYLERNKEKARLFDPQLKKYQNQAQRQKDLDVDNDEKIRNYKTQDEISSAFNITDVNTVTLNSVDQICGIGNLWFARQEKNKIYLENKAHILKNTSNDQKYQSEIK